MLIGAFLLLGICLAALVAGIRIWPDAEAWLAGSCVLASVVAGTAYWRVRRRRDASVGIAFAGVVLTWVCLDFIPSGRWPTTFNGAVEEVHSWLDAGERRDLAYMHEAQVLGQHFGLGRDIRNSLGMWANSGLLESCAGASSPDECSQAILHALRRRLRAELPEVEREAVELLDSRIDRVRVPGRVFEEAPLSEVIAHLQSAINAQLPEADRFRIELDAATAGEFTFRETGSVGLSRWLIELNNQSDGYVEKHPPDLRIEPYYRPIEGFPRESSLRPLFETGQGLDEDLREIIRDEARWRAMWARMSPGSPGAAMPAVDFSRHGVLVVALGRNAIVEPRGWIEATLRGERQGVAHVQVVEREYSASCAEYRSPSGPLPTSAFLIPVRLGDVAFSFHESHVSCPASQANQP